MRNGNSSYSFDQIGNRIEVSLPDEPQALDYISNALNQYTDIEGDSPAYDADGNLTTDGKGKWFSWNGENRMIEARDYDQTPVDGSTRTLFTYDAQGRRVRKTKEIYGDLPGLSGVEGWIPTSDLRYFYDGWNLLYEMDNIGSGPARRYVWGLDLSQSMQGAGGVGGLLFTLSDGVAHAVSYDANGNISEYIDLADGSVDAHLEYDAFGRTIASTGTAPSSFGFSTKYQDEETGYYYYGFRYYDPETGRWPNRDPIGELGGNNLYSFVGNDGVNSWDYLGWSENCCGDPPVKLQSGERCCGDQIISRNSPGAGGGRNLGRLCDCLEDGGRWSTIGECFHGSNRACIENALDNLRDRLGDNWDGVVDAVEQGRPIRAGLDLAGLGVDALADLADGLLQAGQCGSGFCCRE